MEQIFRWRDRTYRIELRLASAQGSPGQKSGEILGHSGSKSAFSGQAKVDDGEALAFEGRRSPAGIHLLLAGRSYDLHLVESNGTLQVFHKGRSWTLEVAEPSSTRRDEAPQTSSDTLLLRSPMVGTITQIRTSPGALVDAGTSLLVITAMKMENEIRIPHRAQVEEIAVQEGQKVERNTLLLRARALPG